MTYTLDRATPTAIVGQLVGDAKSAFIAVVTAYPFLLAVRPDGQEYAVWAYDTDNDDTRVSVYGGHYFNAANYGGVYGAFLAAARDLARESQSWTYRTEHTTRHSPDAGHDFISRHHRLRPRGQSRTSKGSAVMAKHLKGMRGEYIAEAIHQGAITLQWQASDASGDGYGYPIADRASYFTYRIDRQIGSPYVPARDQQWRRMVHRARTYAKT
jgi:hypothetical protein